MIRSMTGFGRGEAAQEPYKITVEVKSVNHRFLDISVRLPRMLNAFEAEVRNHVKSYANRGKVDLYISCERAADDSSTIHYNSQLAGEYIAMMRAMIEQYGLQEDIHASTVARMPEVFTLEEKPGDEEALEKLLLEAVDQACGKFVEARSKEGESLRTDLIAKLDGILEELALIEKRSPDIIREYREKLESRVSDMIADGSIDPGRIAAEVVLYADKICIDEEMVRLRSHIESMKKTLLEGSEEGIGRKLDFIAQEMNREANTILSKANDETVSGSGIILKTEIEKIREQIQNIE